MEEEGGTAMNAVEMLKADHQRVRELFREITAATQKPQPVVQQVLKELETHATLEEEIFYPALRAKAGEADEKIRGLLDEALKEHQKVKDIIAKVKALEPRDEQDRDRRSDG
jgi:hemerythrin superfamily protein